MTLVLSLPLNASKKPESRVQQPSRSHRDLQTLLRDHGRREENKALTSLNELIRKHESEDAGCFVRVLWR